MGRGQGSTCTPALPERRASVSSCPFPVLYHLSRTPAATVMREGLLLDPPRKRNYPNSEPGVYAWSDLGAAGLWGLQHKRQKLKVYQIQTEGLSIEADTSPGLYSGSSAWRILGDVPPSAITYLSPEEWIGLLRENNAIL